MLRGYAHMGSKQLRRFINCLIPILFISSFVLFSGICFVSINNLQGNARVINYTGIIRGATQRLIKQELNYVQNDTLIKSLDEILYGLSHGDTEYNLVVLPANDFQENIKKMQISWSQIKQEIKNVRKGKNTSDLYNMSEDYFELANDTVSAAEMYSENRLNITIKWMLLLNCIFIIGVILFLAYQQREKKIYIELQTAENASREKSMFLSRMSHEIRTPMNGIIGMTEIAKMSLTDPAKTEDCLNKIKLSSDYLLSLINDILDMSRIENGKMELCKKAFDLRDLADRIYGMFSQKADSANLDFEVKTTEISMPVVIGDEIRLSQIVVNIVSNALKFTPQYGKVLVEIKQEKLEDSKCMITITIADTGLGMTEEFQSRIFKPFEQADLSISYIYGGTGLGLAISRCLIQLMEGDITIQSEPDKGSVFTIQLMLPVSEKDPNSTVHNDIAAKSIIEDLAGYHILLAEDNEINAEIAASLLESRGAVVDTAWNGKEAIKQFLNSPAGTYQVILMDIQMPELNGLEACRMIRNSDHSQAKEIPIIGLSANAFEQNVDEAMDCGMDHYVSKPFDIVKLYNTIIKVCNNKHASIAKREAVDQSPTKKSLWK